MKCPKCQADVLEIDVRCAACGFALGSTGAHRMLGKVMLGQYELVDVLGQGGMSVVFKGKHKLTDQEVALKILPPELAAHREVKSRFLDEAKALAALDHPNIVHLYNFGQEDGFFVLAMQLVHGQTWERMILEAKRLDWVTSCRITIDVLRALEYAHGRGIVHRDMKPSNVLVREHDNAATVMDFGIAKMTTSTRLTATGQTMGTVRYMSPEQVRGQEVSLATDIYSLGATLYESLVGDTPFDGETHFEIMTKHLSEVPKRPSSLGVTVPAAVEDALMRSLAKKPEDRYESARDMRKILEQAMREGDLGLVETQRFAGDVVSTLRERPAKGKDPAPPGFAVPTDLSDALEPGDSASRPRRRSKAPLVLAVASLVVAIGGAVVVVVLKNRPAKVAAYQPMTIEGVTITGHTRFGTLTIETDGKLDAKEIELAYRNGLATLREAAKVAKPFKGQTTTVEIRDPAVDVIVPVPQIAMCAPTAYPMGVPPLDCREALAALAIGSRGEKRLMIVNDRSNLVTALTVGAAKAVCEFPADDNHPRHTEICEVTKHFTESK